MAYRLLSSRYNLSWLAFTFIILSLLTNQPAFSQNGGVTEAQTSLTQSIITDQIEAFQSRDHTRAFSHAAPNIQAIFGSVERFIGMVKGGYAALYNAGTYAYGRNTQINGEVYQEVLVTDQAGKQWQAVYTLRQQSDGSWKITGVKINPTKGLST